MGKILFVADSIGYGGASKMLLWVATVLSKDNKVDLCYTNRLSNNIQTDLHYFKLVDKDFKEDALSRNTINLLILTYSLCKLIRREKYDLVISFGDHSFYSLFVSRIFIRFKLMVSERVDPYFARGLSDKIRRFLYRFSNCMVFQTYKAAEYFPKYVQDRSKVIPNPVIGNVKQKWNYESADKSIISVGRIDIIQKRQDLLLDAFSKFSQLYSEYKLKIVGNGPDERKLLALIEEKHLMHNVEYLGFQSNITELLIKSQLFVLTSDFEGIPNALIEALQVEMPIISTDCSPGGAALLLNSGEHGVLVERNNADALYKAMVKAVSSRQMLESMASATHDALSKFSEEKIANEWADWVKECLS